MKALDQMLPCSASDCGSVKRKTGPDEDALAASSKKQAVSGTDMFEEEVKSGSAAISKVEPYDASLVASVGKKQSTFDAVGHAYEDEEEEVNMVTDYDVLDNAPPMIKLEYWTTLDTKDDDLKDELAKHFDRGSDQFKAALEMLGGNLLEYKARVGGGSDHPNGGNVIVGALLRQDGSLLCSFFNLDCE
ncbi:plant Tudor-like RNA-binding protein [Striga asiatica]|uniref:Plant Tudor-like RNA-binding protein n=1 Tax=Striga asiatica TaxID=4170 RepID=A0A5A7R6M5_STRAF|nr:plant Tudor-like RNA-binding protein [Striga asiatica]